MKKITALLCLFNISLAQAQLSIGDQGITFSNHSFSPVEEEYIFPEIGDQCDIEFFINNVNTPVPIGGVEIYFTFPNNAFFDLDAIIEHPIGWTLTTSSLGPDGYAIVYTNVAVLPNGYSENVKLRGVALQYSLEDFEDDNGFFEATTVSLRYTDAPSGWSITPESLSGYSKTALVGEYSPLNLSFLSFEASKMQKNALLQWSAANDNPSTPTHSYFNVQRSFDGIEWHTIGQIKAASDNTRYEFIDYHTAESINFYRINLVENEQKSTLSTVKTLDFSKMNHTRPSIYPIPANNQITIELAELAADMEVRIIDMTGRLVLSQTLSQKKTTVDLSGLIAGNYVLQMQGIGIQFSEKISIVK